MEFIKGLPGYFQQIFKYIKKFFKKKQKNEPIKIQINDDDKNPLYIQIPGEGKLGKAIKVITGTSISFITRAKYIKKIIKYLKGFISNNPYDPIDQTDEYLQREQEKEEAATRKLADSIIRELKKQRKKK